MKKIISLILALMMVCSLATVASAEETGSITIAGIALGDDGKPLAKYTIYKLLDVESYSHDSVTNITSISYVATNPVWKQFFKDSINYNVDEVTGVVTLIGNPDTTTVAKATAAAAKNKIDELNSDSNPANDITPVCTSKCDTAGHIVIEPKPGTKLGDLKFDKLPLGYYLIESDMGILCGIDTTSPHGLINAKNAPPTVTKQVREDSTNTLNETNHADIGQMVEFVITVTAQAGAENYKVHDTMTSGLTFDATTVQIDHLVSANGHASAGLLTLGTDYTVSTDCTDGCSFEIAFDNTFLNTVGSSDKLVITYQAQLNDNALIGTDSANENKVYISYGNNYETEEDTTKTYTFLFDIVKIDGHTKNLLDGAKFALSTKEDIVDDDGNIVEADVIQLVDMGVVGGVQTYHLVHENMPAGHVTTDRIVAKDGKARILGLDAAVYYLTETEAPAGYNKLSSSHSVSVDAMHNWVAYDSAGNRPSSTTGVIIENNSGNELPQTGAMGTAMFISFGMFMVIGTGLLLVTKKRMSMIQD